MHIAHGAIGIHRHCTVGWCAHDGHHTCWRTVFGIGVVALDRYHHGVTFVHRRCVVIRHWRIIDWIDGDVDCRCIGHDTIAVGHGIGEAVRGGF